MFKKLKRSDEELKYDFLPSALEIIEKPASPLGKIIIYIITIFMAIVLIWACLAKIDNVVVSTGKTTPIGGVKVIDSNINGKIVKIEKEEGDEVKTGDVILRIENNDADSQVDKIKSNLTEKRLMLDIVEHKIASTGYNDVYGKYDIDLNKLEEIKLSETLNQEEIEKENQDYIDNINQINQDISKAKSDIEELQKKYDNMSDVDKFINGKQSLEEIKSKKEQIERLEKSKLEAQERNEDKIKEKNLSYIKERNKLQQEINELENSMKSISDNNSRFEVKSPIDGTIVTSNYNTIGSYVNQSKPVAEIVPSDAELEIETMITNKDISRINVGQEVVVKLESYDYQKYGTLSGKVKYISPNAFNDENSGLVYKVKVEFDKSQNEKITVLPGMISTLEIKSDKMRVIEYFLQPFMKHIDGALKG